MRRGAAFAVKAALALVIAAGLCAGAGKIWRQRPWRTVASVNGVAMSAREAEVRAAMLMQEAVGAGGVHIPESRLAEAAQHYRREAVKNWLVKTLLLHEAVARGVALTPADEQAALVLLAERLKPRGISPDDFFRQGPLSEEANRHDFREGVLVNKFIEKTLLNKIEPGAEAVELRIAELKRYVLTSGDVAGLAKIRADRRTAEEMLRAEKLGESFRALLAELSAKAAIEVEEFPELGRPGALVKSKGAAADPAAAQKETRQ